MASMVAGCAQVQQRQQLAEPVGPVLRTPVGGTIATITKDRDLPNAFGGADIYGRTLDAGFTRVIYRGRAADGSVLIEQLNVQSNAGTLTRPLITNTPTQPAVLSSRERAVAYGTLRTVSIASPADQVAAMPMPSAAQFSIPKQQRSLTLPTGQTVEFIAAEPHQLLFRIVDQGM